MKHSYLLKIVQVKQLNDQKGDNNNFLMRIVASETLDETKFYTC